MRYGGEIITSRALLDMIGRTESASLALTAESRIALAARRGTRRAAGLFWLLAGGLGVVAFAKGQPSTSWPQRVEADWVLAERVALLSTAAEAVTTQADAAGGCDGVKNGEWGFHTGESQAPWWQVDLGETQPIARVTIWNRTAAAERARQIRVLLSEDGRTFRQVYQHDGTVFYGFADGKPLDVELHGQAGRFVRLALPGKVTSISMRWKSLARGTRGETWRCIALRTKSAFRNGRLLIPRDGLKQIGLPAPGKR